MIGGHDDPAPGLPRRKLSLSARFKLRMGAFALDVAFELPAGITILFGASGAGKTTLLNCLAGLRARRWKIIAGTLGLIRREDPFLWNKLRLPWFLFCQVLISFVPPPKPLPKG